LTDYQLLQDRENILKWRKKGDNIGGMKDEDEEENPEIKNQGFSGLKPETFDGTNDPMPWMEAFRSYASLMKWQNNQKLMSFPLLLRGDARSWYTGLSQDCKETWDDLENNLLNGMMIQIKNGYEPMN